MSTFFCVYILQIPWGNPSFKDFAGVVFYHFDLGINWSQLAVHYNQANLKRCQDWMSMTDWIGYKYQTLNSYGCFGYSYQMLYHGDTKQDLFKSIVDPTCSTGRPWSSIKIASSSERLTDCSSFRNWPLGGMFPAVTNFDVYTAGGATFTQVLFFLPLPLFGVAHCYRIPMLIKNSANSCNYYWERDTTAHGLRTHHG